MGPLGQRPHSAPYPPQAHCRGPFSPAWGLSKGRAAACERNMREPGRRDDYGTFRRHRALRAKEEPVGLQQPARRGIGKHRLDPLADETISLQALDHLEPEDLTSVERCERELHLDALDTAQRCCSSLQDLKL